MAENEYVAPHHRVDAKVHRAARRKASREGVSLSAVADAGLRVFTSDADEATRVRAKSHVKHGTHAARTPTLPEDIAETLREMSATKDPRFSAYLDALKKAGWSLANLATPLGVSRQAIHVRLSGWDGVVPEGELPPVPPGRGNTQFPAYNAVGGDRFDWSVWAERELYAVATEHAAAKKLPMREVMEGVLRDFVSGDLEVTRASASKGMKFVDEVRGGVA